MSELGDFLEAENFQQVVSKMEESKCANRDRQECLDQQQNISEYKIEQLNPSVKEEVIRYINKPVLLRNHFFNLVVLFKNNTE